MGITLQLADGTLVPAGGGPYQYTEGGYESLPTNSVPAGQWIGGASGLGGLSFDRIYRTQPWVATCVNFLARQTARLPLKVYTKNSQGVKEPVTSGALYDLVRKPADRCGPVHLKQWMTLPSLLHGNSTILKVRPRRGAPPTSLKPLRWSHMTPYELIAGSDEIDYWVCTQFGEELVLLPYDVLHIAWAPPSGVVGVSPLQQLGVTLWAEIAAQKYARASMRNAARPSGGITLPSAMADDKEFRRELRSDLERLHQGEENAGRPIILPPESKWESFSMTAREAELISSRKLNREEVAAVFNAPQPLIGILDHATYSNIAELHKILYGPVLGPWFALEEETFKAHVIDGEPAFEGQFVEYDLAAVLSGDPLKEALALKTQIQTGLLTINEARQLRNLPRIDDPNCDKPLIPVNNLAPVGSQAQTEQSAIADAVAKNLDRAGARLYRRIKAGDQDVWDPARFERELDEDLADAGDHNHTATAKTWTEVIGVIVADGLDDPDELRASFDALNPRTAGDPTS